MLLLAPFGRSAAMIRHYEGGLYGDFKMDAIWNHDVI